MPPIRASLSGNKNIRVLPHYFLPFSYLMNTSEITKVPKGLAFVTVFIMALIFTFLIICLLYWLDIYNLIFEAIFGCSFEELVESSGNFPFLMIGLAIPLFFGVIFSENLCKSHCPYCGHDLYLSSWKKVLQCSKCKSHSTRKGNQLSTLER